VILDLDRFKQVNDEHGHLVGDRVLQEVAQRLSSHVREGEVLARVGGEEFAWILPDADAQGAFAAAERARLAVSDSPIPPLDAVTVSAGVCDLEHAQTITALYEHADRALYSAKQEGRDRTVRYSAGTDTAWIGWNPT
jgi:diguanylate cyclase (GGDEF)-like protein